MLRLSTYIIGYTFTMFIIFIIYKIIQKLNIILGVHFFNIIMMFSMFMNIVYNVYNLVLIL